MVTSDLRTEVEIWPFRACVMDPARVRYSFGQKWKTETGRQYFTDIIGLSSTTVTF